MTIYIKNMVCRRCKMVVESELTKLGLHFTSVELGVAEIMEDISTEQQDEIRSHLSGAGLELIGDAKTILVEEIKKVIVQLVHCSEEPLSTNLSVYLSRLFNHNYTYMSTVFSQSEGHSIERFVIEHRIERAKELLRYNKLNLTEIAYKLHYSSVAHLSSQFKKVTGKTPSHYKSLTVPGSSPLKSNMPS